MKPPKAETHDYATFSDMLEYEKRNSSISVNIETGKKKKQQNHIKEYSEAFRNIIFVGIPNAIQNGLKRNCGKFG